MNILNQEKINLISEILKEMKYGTLLITVNDGQIVQIDRTDKIRIEPKNKIVKKRY
jgi:hypothetical protein